MTDSLSLLSLYLRECTNLEIQVDIETKPSHLCLNSEEDLGPPPVAMAPGQGEEPQDCSSRRGRMLSGSSLALSPGVSLREGLRDVTLAQPESIRSDLEMSDTQSDDIAELTSDDCDSPHPKSCRPPPPPQPTCRALYPSDGLHCSDNMILYVWGREAQCCTIPTFILFLLFLPQPLICVTNAYAFSAFIWSFPNKITFIVHPDTHLYICLCVYRAFSGSTSLRIKTLCLLLGAKTTFLLFQKEKKKGKKTK